jgi:hypothetical protein
VALPVQSRAWPRVQNAIGAWAAGVTGLEASPADPLDATVIWANYDRGELRKPYVSLQRLTVETIGRNERYIGERPSSRTITVTAPTGGQTSAAVQLFWATVRVAAGVDEEVTRDALLTALQATLEPLEFVSAGVDAITVTGAGGGAVECAAIEGCTVATGASAYFRVSRVDRIYKVRVQLYAFDGDGADAIDEYADALLSSLQQPDDPIGLPILAEYGVGVNGVPPVAIDVTAASGALYERRLYFDVGFVTPSILYYTQPVGVALAAAPALTLLPP